MLTLANKTQVRRHLGYPLIGVARTSQNGGGTLMAPTAGYRYNQAFGILEFRMNNMSPDEEAALLGVAFAGVALVGPQPNPGDTLTVTLSGGPIPSPQTIVVTAGPTIPQADMRLPLMLGVAQGVANNPVLQVAGVYGFAPYGAGPYAQNAVPLPEVGITAATAFTISASGTGQIAPEITATGTLANPNTTLDGVTTINGYIPILEGLLGAYASASQNLDTSKADVWTARGSEIAQRTALYKNWQALLADFMAVPVNPWRRWKPSRIGAVRYG